MLGFGLGMFIDGIVLHQILQWHHLVSEWQTDQTIPGIASNVFWDGVFHLSAWFVVLLGLALLWGASRRATGPWSGNLLSGALLLGWGLFNIVDQFLFHMALGAHHIRNVESYQFYDWSFFALGLLLMALGWWLVQKGRTNTLHESAPR